MPSMQKEGLKTQGNQADMDYHLRGLLQQNEHYLR